MPHTKKLISIGLEPQTYRFTQRALLTELQPDLNQCNVQEEKL